MLKLYVVKSKFFSKHQRFLIATESCKYLLIFVLYVCVILLHYYYSITCGSYIT
jgi:hypothetical protein